MNYYYYFNFSDVERLSLLLLQTIVVNKVIRNIFPSLPNREIIARIIDHQESASGSSIIDSEFVVRQFRHRSQIKSSMLLDI